VVINYACDHSERFENLVTREYDSDPRASSDAPVGTIRYIEGREISYDSWLVEFTVIKRDGQIC
jgi:hypothetical protein